MNLKHYYWYFKDAVPLRICDDIIKYGNQQKKLLAVTGPYQDKKLSSFLTIEVKISSEDVRRFLRKRTSVLL